MPWWTRLVSILLVCAAAAPSVAQPDSVFFLPGRERPTRIVVTIGDTLKEPDEATDGMVGLLNGIIADLKGAHLGQFLATAIPRTKLVDARGNLERIGVAHAFGKSAVKRIEIFSGNEGVFIAQEMRDLDTPDPSDSPQISRLDPTRFRAVLIDWPRYQGPIESVEPPAPNPPALAKPYAQAPFYLDQQTLGDRFLRGRKSDLNPVERVLQQEEFFLRLPREYDPKRPTGLLIWISPAQDGRLPAVLNPALDELGLIGIGIQNVGNDRYPTDRYQLALDAMWTASRQFHIDPRRVYLTGMSGGGKITSMLLACFPDYFAGAVPIVGMSAYFNVPVGNGSFVRAGYERPDAKIWALTRQRRLAPITGDRDPNSTVIRQAAPRMVADGIPIRVFDFKDLAHTLPSPLQFSEALRWVDEPYRVARQKEEAAAAEALAKYRKKFGDGPPENDRLRQDLLRVTQLGPWTDAAWQAVAQLRRAPRPDPGDAR